MDKIYIETQIRGKEKLMRELLPFNSSNEKKKLWHQLKDEVEVLWKQLRCIEKNEKKNEFYIEKGVEL